MKLFIMEKQEELVKNLIVAAALLTQCPKSFGFFTEFEERHAKIVTI